MLIFPETSSERYISSIVALNIVSPKATGDWHANSILWKENSIPENVFFVGEDQHTNTNPLLGDLGVIDITSRLEKMGYSPILQEVVYGADHPRACFDLLYQTVIEKGHLTFVRLDDWFPSDEDKKEVYDLISIAEPKLSSHQLERLAQWKKKNPIK